MDNKWRLAPCGCCAGIEWGGDYPQECRTCGGGGFVYIRPSGHVFQYPGGPALGQWTQKDYTNSQPVDGDNDVQ